MAKVFSVFPLAPREKKLSFFPLYAILSLEIESWVFLRECFDRYIILEFESKVAKSVALPRKV